MNVQRRDFLLLVALAAAAATPALGQTALRKTPHPSQISPACGPTHPGPASSRRYRVPARW